MATSGKKQQTSVMTRLTGILGFFIGIFGALAILGVFFKIIKWPNYEIFMVIGFIGEAAAFVIMGLFSLIGSFTGRKAPDMDTDAMAVGQVMDGKTSQEINALLHQLRDEIDRFGSEVREMSGQMERTRSSLQNMRAGVSEMVDGNLADDADRLGKEIKFFGSEMHEMGTGMRDIRNVIMTLRSELDKMADGDLSSSAVELSSGMREFGGEIHEMNAELEHSRTAMHNMRQELNKVVSGNLAEDAERFSTGMKLLGDEMESAGGIVERIRADLDQMATRFHQFNNPVAPTRNGVTSRIE